MKERFKVRYDSAKSYDNPAYKKQIPKSKIPLFIRVFEEIKKMGGGVTTDGEHRGFSANVVERLYTDSSLNTDMARKILDYHAYLKEKTGGLK